MNDEPFEGAVLAAKERIARAIAKGPMGRAVVAASGQGVELPPIEEEGKRKMNAFESMRAAFSRLTVLFPEVFAPLPESQGPEAETGVVDVDLPKEEAPDHVSASAQEAETPLVLLRRLQRANVERESAGVPPIVYVSSPEQGAALLPPSSQASNLPSLKDLLDRMGRREFSRIVGDTMQFDRSRLGLGQGHHFVAHEGHVLENEPKTPSSFEDQSALRQWCRMSVAAATARDPSHPLSAFEEVERRLIRILDLDRKLRPVEPSEESAFSLPTGGMFPEKGRDIKISPAEQEARATFRRLLDAVGEPAFRRIVETPMGLACAREGFVRRRNFLDTMPSGQHEGAKPVPAPLYAELCGACHKSIAARGVIETESLIFDVLSRKEESQPVVAPASVLSGFVPSTILPDAAEKETTRLVDEHMRASMDASWRPDPGIEDRLRSARIDLIESQEGRLKKMEEAAPSVIANSGTEPREEWSPRAHELRAAHDRAAGRSVDERALQEARQGSALYRIWRSAMRALGGEKPSVDLKPSALPEEYMFEPRPEPVGSGNRIRNVRPGVYELTK